MTGSHYVTCPICESVVTRSLAAQVAPLIRECFDVVLHVEGRSHFCSDCEHVFLTPFLDAEKIERLHNGIGEERNADRVAEPVRSCDNSFGVALHQNDKQRQVRREFYDDFHAERFAQRGLVVDASGGDGYFARYAYPWADVVVLPRVGLPPGVDLATLLPAADVLMSTHVLQTEPQPNAWLGRLARGLKAGSSAWIEVPIAYRGSLRASFEVQEARTARGLSPTGPLQELTQTVAHFSVRSLRHLLTRVGLTPVEWVRSSIGVLGVSARKS